MYNLHMKILIVEDDLDISEFMKIGFEAEGYPVDTASDGERGSYMARTTPYGVIILDYSLPIKNGFEVCNEIRAAGSSVPIIFLSATIDAQKKIDAFSKGADDYITKPFHFDELKARVKAVLRRPQKIENPVLQVGPITLDTEKRTVCKDGVALYCTRKEYGLLEYLMRNPNIPVSRSMIMEHVWNSESDPFSNTVEAHILNLRKKINTPGKKDMIRNVPGRGYLIES